MNRRSLVGLLSVVVLAVGCSSGSPTPAGTPTIVPSILVSPSPEPPATPEPTATPTPTPSPTPGLRSRKDIYNEIVQDKSSVAKVAALQSQLAALYEASPELDSDWSQTVATKVLAGCFGPGRGSDNNIDELSDCALLMAQLWSWYINSMTSDGPAVEQLMIDVGHKAMKEVTNFDQQLRQDGWS